MSLYFLMGNITENGHLRLRENPQLLLEAARDCESSSAKILTQYAVLGRFDFVMLAEADDNDAVARLSLDMSCHVGMYIETLPAIALGPRMDLGDEQGDAELAYADQPNAEWRIPDQDSDAVAD